MQPDEPSRILRELQSSVTDFLFRATGRHAYRVAIRKGVVKVRLATDEISLAAELVQEFGSSIQVIVGFKVFPGGEAVGLDSLSHRLHEESRDLPGIRVSFEPAELRMYGGEAGAGEVFVHNAGARDLAGSIGGGVGWLRRPRTTLIAGGYSGWLTGARRRLALTPGQRVSIRFVTGTASCESGPDFVVAQGRYEVVVPLKLEISGAEEQTILAEGAFAVVL